MATERISFTSAGIRIDRQTPEGAVLIVHLWRDPDECSMCSGLGFHTHAVPWYCGPVAEGDSEGGCKTVCRSCYHRWAAWDAGLRYGGA